jgi:hypothetical protein
MMTIALIGFAVLLMVAGAVAWLTKGPGSRA